jgi:hypothetical protein
MRTFGVVLEAPVMVAARRRVLTVLGLLLLISAPRPGSAQMNNIRLTGGVSWENYDGNLPAVASTVVDSSTHAQAAIGQLELQASLRILRQQTRWLDVRLLGGVRQFNATGFTLRDYAPREWVSSVDATFTQEISDKGRLAISALHRSREVQDRPPMPIYMQPAYSRDQASVQLQLNPSQGVAFDGAVDVERTNYDAQPLLPDVLDSNAKGFELGASTQPPSAWWAMRFYAGVRWSDYEQQSTLDEIDPFRRDRTVTMGARWSYDRSEDLEDESLLRASLGVQGTVNRSNSNRPEYDALNVSGTFFRRLPWWDLATQVEVDLTAKSYVHETPFARLVPGEEADNASRLYLDVQKPLSENLTSTVRFGWTRAETDIGRSYYRRLGMSLLMTFRPSRF